MPFNFLFKYSIYGLVPKNYKILKYKCYTLKFSLHEDVLFWDCVIVLEWEVPTGQLGYCEWFTTVPRADTTISSDPNMFDCMSLPFTTLSKIKKNKFSGL